MKVRSYRGKWVADYSDQFGKRHRHSFDTRREANDHLIEAKSAIRGGTFRPEAAKTVIAVPAAEFIEQCRARVASGELGAATAHNYIGHTERYVLGTRDLWSPARPELKGVVFNYLLGQLRLSDVDGAVLEDFRRALLHHGLARGTVRLVLVCVSRIFECARKKNLVATNPVRDFHPPKSKRENLEVPIPEKDSIRKLIAHTPERGRMHIMFAAATGVRAGEQRALQWADIDFENRRVKIQRSVDRFCEFGPPKSSAGYRTVPLPSSIIEALEKYRAESTFDQPHDLVFPGERGEPVHHSVWINGFYNKAWKALQASPEGRGVKRCKWHALRHFAISTWIEKGAPLKRVQKWAGHSTPAMTLNVYTHLFDAEDHAEIIDQIGTEMFGES